TAHMVKEHDLFLAGLDKKQIFKKEVLREFSAADDEDEIEELLAEPGNTVPATGFDIPKLRAAVQADRDLLADLCNQATSVTPANDPKLAALIEALAGIVKEADKEAIDEADRCRKRE